MLGLKGIILDCLGRRVLTQSAGAEGHYLRVLGQEGVISKIYNFTSLGPKNNTVSLSVEVLGPP